MNGCWGFACNDFPRSNKSQPWRAVGEERPQRWTLLVTGREELGGKPAREGGDEFISECFNELPRSLGLGPLESWHCRSGDKTGLEAQVTVIVSNGTERMCLICDHTVGCSHSAVGSQSTSKKEA